MSGTNLQPSAPLAAFDNAACCFDRGLMAARQAVIAENSGHESNPGGVLLDIAPMMRLLKSEGRAAIGLLATSSSVEHHAMAEGCRSRLANAVNLHRTTSRCIREGIVPPLPELHERIAEQAKPDTETWQTAWAMVWVRAWYLPWMSD